MLMELVLEYVWPIMNMEVNDKMMAVMDLEKVRDLGLKISSPKSRCGEVKE